MADHRSMADLARPSPVVLSDLRIRYATARLERREALAKLVASHVFYLHSDPLGARQPPDLYERYYGVADAILTMLDRGEPQL